jgi:hypothetical protein
MVVRNGKLTSIVRLHQVLLLLRIIIVCGVRGYQLYYKKTPKLLNLCESAIRIIDQTFSVVLSVELTTL